MIKLRPITKFIYFSFFIKILMVYLNKIVLDSNSIISMIKENVNIKS